MNVVCIEEKAFDNLLDRMFKYVRSQLEINTVDKWIDKKEAKRLLWRTAQKSFLMRQISQKTRKNVLGMF